MENNDQNEIRSEVTTETVYPPNTLRGEAGKRMLEAKAAKRAAAEKYQAENTRIFDGYTIRPAIGSTCGAENVGWELISPPRSGPDWYFSTREKCIDAIARHKAMYAH